MDNKWAHLGHALGECWNDPNKSITFIHIPKNASSFLKECLIGTGQFRQTQSLVQANSYLIALRDPIDRWISGISQFLSSESNQHFTLLELTNTITFDDHTELQTYFLQGIDLDKATFLRVDQNLRKNIQKWLKENSYPTRYIGNVPMHNQGDEKIKNRISDMIDGNSQIKLKLVKHYDKDYKLINKVRFYGT